MLSLLITCVNYSDYLDCTLKYNLEIFDNIYIVTTPDDENTINIINKYNNTNKIKQLTTNIFYDDINGSKPVFNKGGALNYGLSQISYRDWLLIGDADIIYPQKLNSIIDSLDKNYLYGMYRYPIVNADSVDSAVATLNSEISSKNFINDNKLWVGERQRLLIGYCKLFNFESVYIQNKSLIYPNGKSCQHVDTQFSRSYFSKRQRKVLDLYYLDLGKSYVNWYGRKSEKFK